MVECRTTGHARSLRRHGSIENRIAARHASTGPQNSRLRRQGIPAGYKKHTNPGQGNCLVLAVEQYLKKHHKALGLPKALSPTRIRLEAIEHLRKYAQRYEGFWDRRSPAAGDKVHEGNFMYLKVRDGTLRFLNIHDHDRVLGFSFLAS